VYDWYIIKRQTFLLPRTFRSLLKKRYYGKSDPELPKLFIKLSVVFHDPINDISNVILLAACNVTCDQWIYMQLAYK